MLPAWRRVEEVISGASPYPRRPFGCRAGNALDRGARPDENVRHVGRATAGAGRRVAPSPSRRDHRPARQVGERQVDAAAVHRRPHCPVRGERHISGSTGRGSQSGDSDGLPELCAPAVVDRAAERGTRPGSPRRRARRAEPTSRASNRSDRPGRFRVGLPQRTVGGNASAGGLRAGTGGGARGAVDGRTLQRSRRADRGESARRTPGVVGERPVPDQGDRDS
jgi:hypothetical protein